MADIPLVSIILPVHNCERFLSSCLDSLLKQSHENIEIIAIDDKSKDNSLKILKFYKKRDNRIKVFNNVKKYGFPVCFNRAFKKAKGQFIAFMGANDVNATTRIKKQLNYLLSNPKTIVVGSQLVITDKNNRKKGLLNYPQDHQSICKSLIRGLSLNFESIMINKFLMPKDLLKVKKDPYPIYYIDLLIKLLPYGEFANLADFIYYKRKFENNLINTNSLFTGIKLWFKSIFLYDTRPSFYSVFKPATK